ncbi:hypothetical protein BZG36_00855 [Bifiguratus adelaidae]|uniref:Protein-serine/threonine kinase n=1 Tax=Bifiguratus adelaidae TaxID=1938954 RepID=A0A261Y5D2_9FUNG|nr:hypothetical protein BZG36_00855 [Bifiguratus adelaidae]
MVVASQALNAVPKDVMSRLWTSKVTKVSLKQMYAVGRHVTDSKAKQTALLVPAQFLRHELPIRYTHAMRMLNSTQDLPHPSLAHTATFRSITQRYLEDISALIKMGPITNAEEEGRLTELLRRMLPRSRENMLSLANCFRELEDMYPNLDASAIDESRTQRFFDSIYGINLGTNLLMGEHLALHDEGRLLVSTLSPTDIAHQAAQDARKICARSTGIEAPEVQIIERSDKKIITTFVEEHLHRMLFETIKHSLRTTCERHVGPDIATSRTSTGKPSLPSVKVVVVSGGEDISIKISDEGGGMPESKTKKIWSYLDSVSLRNTPTLPDPNLPSSRLSYLDLPLCAPNHGLPFARLVARYFGGDLSLVSMEGYGTDAYLSLYRDATCLENWPDLHDESMSILFADHVETNDCKVLEASA